MQGQDDGTARRRGRRRQPSIDARILRTTIELLSELDADAVTTDEIARRSGCAKTTIYRRWPSRDALLLEALRSAIEPHLSDPPAASSPDEAVRAAVDRLAPLIAGRLFAATFPVAARHGLAGTSEGRRLGEEALRPLRDALASSLAATGPIASGGAPLLADLVVGGLVVRAISGEPVDEGWTATLAALIAGEPGQPS